MERKKSYDTKVSIVVPVYKTEQYLRQCVDSIIAQTYKNIEIILVDDGSPDNCPKLCDYFASIDSRINVIHKSNEGAAIARKSGLDATNGEYILFVDGDDWVEQIVVEECVSIALECDSDCVIFPHIKEYSERSIQRTQFDSDVVFDSADSEANIHSRVVGLRSDQLVEPAMIDKFSTVWGKLYRRSFAKKGRIVSERVVGTSEDTIFNLYALEGAKISYVNKCFYHYRKTNTQSITARYKPDLAEKWDVMYDIMREYIDQSGRKDEYIPLFLNRVACGMIGLGLNEIGSTDSVWKKSGCLRTMLNKPLYIEAFGKLDTSYCDAKWKLFFWLCKKQHTFMLALMLQIMNYLRSRVAA